MGSTGKGKIACSRLGRRLDVILVALLLIGPACVEDAVAEQVRVAMPSRTMGFMNFYVGEKFGIYSAEGLGHILFCDEGRHHGGGRGDRRDRLPHGCWYSHPRRGDGSSGQSHHVHDGQSHIFFDG